MKQFHLDSTVNTIAYYIHTYTVIQLNNKYISLHTRATLSTLHTSITGNSQHLSQHLSQRHIIHCVCDAPPTSQLLLYTRQTNHRFAKQASTSCTLIVHSLVLSVPLPETSVVVLYTIATSMLTRSSLTSYSVPLVSRTTPRSRTTPV